jgi:hypothetical protein
VPAFAFLFFAFLTHAADYILIIQLAVTFLHLFSFISFCFIAMSFHFLFAALIRVLHSSKLNTDVFPILVLFDSAKNESSGVAALRRF